MIRIRVVTADRRFGSLDDIRPSWINQQVNQRVRERQAVWAVVEIEEPGVRVILCTASAPRGPGQPISRFNAKEREIIRLWYDRGLNGDLDRGGALVAFFAQLGKVL